MLWLVYFQTGTITEEEFAVRIESDLHSQHQPSLLPFLKVQVLLASSVCVCVWVCSRSEED